MGVGQRRDERKAMYILEGRWSYDSTGFWIQEKVSLGYRPILGIYGNHRKAHLQHPGIHDVINSVGKFSAIIIHSLWKQHVTVGWHVVEILLIKMLADCKI